MNEQKEQEVVEFVKGQPHPKSKVTRETSPSATPPKVADAPLLTYEQTERDKRDFDLVEINFKDHSAEIVETSKAPQITPKVLNELGKPVKSALMFWDNDWATVHVKDGMPMGVDLRRAKLVDTFAPRLKALLDAGETPDSKKYKVILAEREDVAKRFILSEMIDAPKFSFGGGKYPIEDQSQIFVESLYHSYVEINHPLEDIIYQVKVKRGTPIEIALMVQQGFEIYPLSKLTKKVTELTDQEIQAQDEMNLMQRRILVASMVLNVKEKPIFSYNGQGGGKHAFPVEDISETFLQTLTEAYRIVNVPTAQLSQLQRFPGLGGNYWQNSGHEPLGRN